MTVNVETAGLNDLPFFLDIPVLRVSLTPARTTLVSSVKHQPEMA